MKITIAKENGEFQVALDGEQVGPMKVSREIDLFPGQSAEKEAERLCKLYHQEFAVLQVVSAITPQEPKKEVFA